MFTLNTDGIAALQERIAAARDMVQSLVQEAVQQAGETVVQGLSDAAPRGKNEGDSEGPLAESFYVQEEAAPSESGAAISVRTSQPIKLKFVVEGRGEVLPVNKQALFWPGLDHPVRRAGPTQPNDFVGPVLDGAPSATEVLMPVFEELSATLGG